MMNLADQEVPAVPTDLGRMVKKKIIIFFK